MSQMAAALFVTGLLSLWCAVEGTSTPQLLRGLVQAPLGNEQSLLHQQSFGETCVLWKHCVSSACMEYLKGICACNLLHPVLLQHMLLPELQRC